MSLTLAAGMICDALLGEPKWLWSRVQHPVIYIGQLISTLDNHMNKGDHLKLKGCILLVALLTVGLTVGYLISQLGMIFEVFTIFVLLAQRSLMDHVKAVAKGLKETLEEGQKAVSMIVGRDTEHMTQSDVARAAIESAAENFSDGVIAPIFWYLLLGLPGLVAYKCINTGDSMIGYKTDKYHEFGWATARFDDAMNWGPARLSAVLILASDYKATLSYQNLSSNFRAIRADAKLHRSPNAGWPEAALAYSLNISLAGPRWYHGTLISYPSVNPKGKQKLGVYDIEHCTRLIWKTWGVAICIIVAVLLVCYPLC